MQKGGTLNRPIDPRHVTVTEQLLAVHHNWHWSSYVRNIIPVANIRVERLGATFYCIWNKMGASCCVAVSAALSGRSPIGCVGIGMCKLMSIAEVISLSIVFL